MGADVLTSAVVYLAAAVICVPIAKKLGMGSVLGYILAGILIGPFVLRFVGEEGQSIMHFAEFGVVMMLFLIGLELEPKHMWAMRKSIVGLGAGQTLLSTAIFWLAGLAIGFSWQASLALGLALAMSSTAIVLQSLKEKGMMQTPAGQASFAVLLFQDIAVIPILAILPVLATQTPTHLNNEHSSLLDGLPGWVSTIAVFGAVVAVVLLGRFVVVPLLRVMAKTRMREMFTAASLLIVFGIAALMSVVGLSPALGTFLAGVVLANSEFKHELESDIEPFKGLLLGLFFLAVGASINFELIAHQPLKVLGYVLGIVLVKALVLAVLARIFKLGKKDGAVFSIGLSQVGEFAFVIFSFVAQLSILNEAETDLMMAVVALSMTVTPLLFLVHEQVILPRVRSNPKPKPEADNIDSHQSVVIAGFSHFGSTVGRFLRAHGVHATILDNDPERVDLLRKMGFQVFYGDATRLELLESAKVGEAKLFISAIDDWEVNHQLAETLQKHFPKVEVMFRARNRFDAYELMDLGVNDVYRESIDTSIRLGVDALVKLGKRRYSAFRAGQNFLRYDEAAMRKLMTERHDMEQYIIKAKAAIAVQEELLQNDRQISFDADDHAWDSEMMRQVIQQQNTEAGPSKA